MARPEIDPSLQLRNQESVRLTDTELANINSALEVFNTRNGFKISRSTFLKSNAMAEVARILGGQATSPEAKATSPEVKATAPKAKATAPAVKATKAKVKATSPAVKKSKAPRKPTKKRGAK